MKPYGSLTITSTSQGLAMLDTILEKHPDDNIIHEIGRPTLLHAALEGFPSFLEFRKRLNNHQMLVADFRLDVPYSAEGNYYYAAEVDLITVMAAAQMKRFKKRLVQTFTRNSLPSI